MFHLPRPPFPPSPTLTCCCFPLLMEAFERKKIAFIPFLRSSFTCSTLFASFGCVCWSPEWEATMSTVKRNAEAHKKNAGRGELSKRKMVKIWSSLMASVDVLFAGLLVDKKTICSLELMSVGDNGLGDRR